ncbi:MBL fold metallo-hydrolase [Shimia marina]|uniref:Ribonuclease BN n=2 Tax=Shimia marina TaxID=321267 RepID=A0A0P1EQH5_9RHOB|nr:MBL fold metallo-hydrolase [Shimia marina]CUH52457.1 Ribonuclease BN [Shimia marina]SFE12273.1 Ribonuclease BN, tRNA processing enzyme [Shimia marina]
MHHTQVTLLGTKGGPAIRPGTRMPTSLLIQMDGMTVLVDAGLGVSRALCDAGMALTDLDAILITHLHSDHYLELGPLLHTAWTAGLNTPIAIYGPEGLTQYWDSFLQAMSFDIELRLRDEGRPALAPLAQIHVLNTGDMALGSLQVKVMRNTHPPIIDSFALRIEGQEHSVVLSGDTAPMEEMVSFAQGADLLVHEAMLSAGIDALCARVGNGDDRLRLHLERSHTPAAEAGRIAKDAGVARLALNHLVPCDDPDFTEAHWQEETRCTWDGPLFIGTDGMTISL